MKSSATELVCRIIGRLRLLGLALVITTLIGCGTLGFSSTYYTVQPGDTLYSIAWYVGVDYHKLAKWNDISSSYTIRPGQKLRIRPPDDTREGRRPEQDENGAGQAPAKTHRVRKGETLYRIAKNNRVSVAQLRQWNRLTRSSRIYPGQVLRLGDRGEKTSGNRKHGKAASPRGKRAAVTRSSSNSAAPQRSAIRWAWPVRGKIVGTYDQKAGRKGIDIAGSNGTPIAAAASGTIVYQGSGLRGYGRLIIVKHNNDFLSAYAHCDSFLLKEGSKVKRGTVIAKMGNSGTSRDQLHFEIRYRGNPVNPLGYLPGI